MATIEKDDEIIPIPDEKPGRDGYGFGNLKVNESLAVWTEDKDAYQRVRSAASAYGKRNEREFSTRIVTEQDAENDGKERTGIRVWRVK